MKRGIRIVKHIRRIPIEATCTFCKMHFKAPMTTWHGVADATAHLQRQFNAHQCKQPDAAGTPGAA